MRLLPCPSPGCRSKGALLPPSEAYPNGEPYLSGQYVSDYTCHRCGNDIKTSPAEYHGAKVLTMADFERLAREHGNPALKELPTRDLVGAGFKPKQAVDLFGAGIQTAHDVAAQARKDE